MKPLRILLALAVSLLLPSPALAQDNPGPGDEGPPPFDRPPPFDGPGPFGGPPPFQGFGPFGGPGGPGGPQQETKLVKKFDQNSDKRLDADERKAARAFLKEQSAQGWDRRGPGGRGFGPGGNLEPASPGANIEPADVKTYPDHPAYDPTVLRTFFLTFENADWENELADFHNTDVEVPATLMVDGRTYPEVGVHFRGMSSYMMVPEGRKRSLNLSLDFVHESQNLGGYRTLNLLNCSGDPTFIRGALFSHIARHYIPAPKVNLVRVVINGENWGVYASAQQFNKDFLRDFFQTTDGPRWKAPGSPGGRASLAYLGDDPAAYEQLYDIKSKDKPDSWKSLIDLCQTLTQTPTDQLARALDPILDINGTLLFLALENVLINEDGYWLRTSDYNLYQDLNGRFHLIPHDSNETFTLAGGPGGPGGPRAFGRRGGPGGFGGAPAAEGVKVHPLTATNDTNKVLLNKLLAVPELRARYLGYVRHIAENWLDWNQIGPVAQSLHALIDAEVKADTRKLGTYEAFANGLQGTAAAPERGPGGGRISLKSFADQRRAYLLDLPEVKSAPLPKILPPPVD